MIIKRLENLLGTPREVDWGNGMSRRFLVASERMGFSLTDTIVNAGTCSRLEYKQHLEACYCISGEGEIRNDSTGQAYPILPGTMYALDEHDAHHLIAKTDLRLVCVFLPALQGHETHHLGQDGTSSY